MTKEILDLLAEQQRDDEFGCYVRNRPLEILAGLNPHAVKRSRPRYFLSARQVKRRRRGAEVTHGMEAMYKRGCRCKQCRSQHSQRNKAWRAKAAA